jgi:hypothetical protein
MESIQHKRPRPADSFGLLFALLLATMLMIAADGDDTVGRVVVLVFAAAATWQALRASHVQRAVLRLAVAVIPVATLIAVVLTLVDNESSAEIVSGMLLLLLVVVSPVAIARSFARNPVVTANTFFAAVSVYLLVAMFFATLYSLIATITGDPFFAQHTDARAVDYLYFSFTTITTTGYGDYTAAGGLGKMTAMIEAIMGQLYLITVVALVVQNLSRVRQRRIKEEKREQQD